MRTAGDALVVDASAVVAALIDDGPDGRWAEAVVAREPLAAPHLMQVEAANILRRAVLAGQLSQDSAALAHDDLLGLRVELFPYEPFARRVWQLRHNLPSYDGWYVALAESLGAVVATLDERLTQASGPQCDFEGPPARS